MAPKCEVGLSLCRVAGYKRLREPERCVTRSDRDGVGRTDDHDDRAAISDARAHRDTVADSDSGRVTDGIADSRPDERSGQRDRESFAGRCGEPSGGRR